MKIDYKTLLANFIDICLFKEGPQVLPESSDLNLRVLALYFLSGVILLSSGAALGKAIIEAFIETALLTGFVYTVLWFFSIPHRFNQTLLALLGTGFIFTSVSVPFIYSIEASISAETSANLSSIILFVLFSWSIAVMAYIVRKATNKSFAISIIITFCYLYLSYQVINLIYPAVN